MISSAAVFRRCARFWSYRRSVVLALVLGLSGCGLPIQAPHVQETWRLDAPRVTTNALPIDGKNQTVTLLLRPIKATQGLQTSAMMYSRAPQILAPYRDNRWLAPPAEMIADALGQTLANQSWVAGVLRTGGTAKAQLAIDCRVEVLEHDIYQAQGAAHLVMDCLWLDPRNRHIQAHLRFDQTERLAHNTAADFAAGAQALLNRAVLDIVQQTRQLASSPALDDASD